MIIYTHYNTKTAKNDNFPPNDKKMTNKMIILQVAKIAFFSKHCHFVVIFLSFFNQVSIFFHILEKIAPQRQKMTNFPPNDKK
jgi:hypothetical protein